MLARRPLYLLEVLVVPLPHLHGCVHCCVSRGWPTAWPRCPWCRRQELLLMEPGGRALVRARRQDCVTKYKRHKGSPTLHGEENEDANADDVSDYNYPASGNQDQKEKIAGRMLTWCTNSQGSDVGLAKYDSGEIGHAKYDSGEIPRGYIPSLTHSQISGEIPGASPDHMMSPVGNIGSYYDQIFASRFVPANPSREFSGSLGNVAWKESGWMENEGQGCNSYD